MNDIDLLLPRPRVSPESRAARRQTRVHDLGKAAVAVASLLALLGLIALVVVAGLRGWS